MSPPAQPLPSLPRLPHGALGGPGLRLSASPSFCVQPATLSLCWLPGAGGVPRVWGNAAGLFLRPAQKGRASCVSSLWCSQAEGGTESPPGPPVLAQGQQAGLEGTKGFLHPPTIPSWCPLERSCLPAGAPPPQPCCTGGAPSGLRALSVCLPVCPLSPPPPVSLLVSVLPCVSLLPVTVSPTSSLGGKDVGAGADATFGVGEPGVRKRKEKGACCQKRNKSNLIFFFFLFFSCTFFFSICFLSLFRCLK